MNVLLRKLTRGIYRTTVLAMFSGMLLLMGGCSGPSPSAAGVTVSIATPQEEGTNDQQLSGVGISTAYPALARMTMQIVANGYTTAQINKDYNGGGFTPVSGADAIEIVDTVFRLNVPNDVDITFILTAYNPDGYQVFSGIGKLNVAQLQAGDSVLGIALKVDIDSAVPVLASVTGCADADGDDYCDAYEDIFVTLAGVADIDGDGVVNSADPDADGDGLADALDGDTASNDGYPSFIHANNAPTAVGLSLTAVSGTKATGIPTVIDPDLNDCHVITVATAPALGTASAQPTGIVPTGAPSDCDTYSIAYTPPNGYIGSVTFSITATDRAGASISGDVSVTVGAAVATAPSTRDTTVTTNEDVPLAITLTANDINGDALTYSVVSVPLNGSLSGTTPDLTYTPNSNFNGSDSFTFKANDGSADSNISTVTITVTAVNDAPVAVDDGKRSLARVSLDSNGIEANGASAWPMMSDNGRLTVFWSAADNLVAGDTNGFFDLFMHDAFTGETTRLTVDSNGIEADKGQTNATQLHPAALSVDGRYVVFESTAGNLGAFVSGISQLYKRDRLEGSTQIMTSCESEGDGASYEPVMTPDGNHIVFTSKATDPWPGCGSEIDSNGFSDIYIDSSTYFQRRVSVDAAGLLTNNQTDGDSYEPAIDDAGGLIVFTSRATNLIASDANGALSDIFLKNLSDESVTLISVDSAGTQAGGGNSYSPSISGDGRYVAFASAATNLISGDTNGAADVFVHDTLTGTTERVSVDSAGGEANGASGNPSISKDGRYVLFESSADNLDTADGNGAVDLFIHDRTLGLTTLISSDAAGLQGNKPSSMPVFSGDGLQLAFATAADNLAVADGNGVSDVIAMSLTDIVTEEAIALTTINVLSNDTDVENDTLFVSANTAGSGGTVVSLGDGTFTYTPNNGFSGLDKFRYTAGDGVVDSNSAVVSIGVGVANYAPQGVNDSATTTSATPVIIDVLANDFDLDNDTLAINSADTLSANGGTITINADNTLTFTPNTGMTPPYYDSFSYTAKDGTTVSNVTAVLVYVPL